MKAPRNILALYLTRNEWECSESRRLRLDRSGVQCVRKKDVFALGLWGMSIMSEEFLKVKNSSVSIGIPAIKKVNL